MTPADLLDVLRTVHREKLTMRQRHAAVARQVSHYEFNNTYQYVIAREDVHLAWLEAAIAELGGTPDQLDEPTIATLGKKESFLPFVAQDSRDAGEFVTRWREKINGVGNARHRGMVQVILGETLEQKRFFDQMGAGQEDLLGRKSNGPGKEGTGDGVMNSRWVGQ